MDIIHFLENLNWQGIIAMFSIVWYFTHDIKVAMQHQSEKMDKLSDRMDKQSARTDQLYQMFVDLLKEKK